MVGKLLTAEVYIYFFIRLKKYKIDKKNFIH